MTFGECIKRKFQCEGEIGRIKVERDRAVEMLNGTRAEQITDHYRFLMDGCPSMDQMIKDGRAQPMGSMEFIRIIERDCKIKLKSQVPMTVSTDVPLYIHGGGAQYVIPKLVFLRYARNSMINRFKYEASSKPPARQFVCAMFAWALYCEMQAGPLWDVYCAYINVLAAGTTSHGINLVTFSDDKRAYYFEPQTDRLYLPDYPPRTVII
jgi:hypothetical protein